MDEIGLVVCVEASATGVLGPFFTLPPRDLEIDDYDDEIAGMSNGS